MRRRLKQTADFCRWSIYLLIVLAAVLVVLSRVLITQLYLYQSQIESYLGEVLLTKVSADKARGVWNGLYPVIELEEVRLGDDPENPGLRAAFVRAVPNYLQSIRLQTPIWEELSIEGMAVEIHQNPDSGWTIASLSASGSELGRDGSSTGLADMLFRSHLINIENLSFNYLFLDGKTLNLTFSQMKVENDPGFHRLSISGQVDGDQNGVEGILELTGQSYRFEEMRGEGYLSLQGADMGNIFGELLEGYVDTVPTAPVLAEGQIWFDIRPGSRVEMVGDVALSDLHIGNSDAAFSFQSKLWGQRMAPGDWRLDMVDFSLARGDQIVAPMQFSVRRDKTGIRLMSERLSLDQINPQIRTLEVIPDGLRETLESLSLSGDLASASLRLSPSNSGFQWAAEGNLETVSANAFRGAPRIEDLTGYFAFDRNGGEILINANDAKIHFERLFAEPLIADSLSGQVAWKIDRRRGELSVYSSPIRLIDGPGQKLGQFRLVTPILDGDFLTDLTLIAGLREGAASEWPKLLPKQSGAGLIDWFEKTDIQGAISESGFIYRGAIRREEAARRTFQLVGELDNASLNFASNWPRLTEMRSRYWLSNGHFYTHTEAARLGPMEISNAVTDILVSGGANLSTQGQLSGDLADLQVIFKTGPLRPILGDRLANLDFSGPFKSQIELQLPIRTGLRREDVVLQAHSFVEGGSLSIGPSQLPVGAIGGNFVYDDAGFHSDGFSAEFLGNSLKGTIKTEQKLFINLNSNLALASLESLEGFRLPKEFSGSLDVAAEMAVSLDGESGTEIRFQSDTLGLLSELPQPLSKGVEQSREVKVLFAPSSGDSSSLDLSWGEGLNLSLDFSSGEVIRGTLGISAPQPEKENGKFVGALNLQRFDLNEWLTTVAGRDSSADKLAYDFYIDSAETIYGGTNLGRVESRSSYAGWVARVAFVAPFAAGVFESDRSDLDQPYRIDLEWLDLADLPKFSNNEQGDSDSSASGAAPTQIDPRKLPPMTLDVQDLRYADRRWGEWHAELNPTDSGTSITNISASFEGASIDLAAMNTLAWNYDGQQHKTILGVQMNLGNLENLFQQLNRPPAVFSESGTVVADLEWPGVPWKPTWSSATGEVIVALNNGKFNAQPSGDALLKLVGLFSIDNWGRRLKFDFSDLTAGGTGYKSFRGDFALDKGIVRTIEPVNITLLSGRLRLDGDVDLLKNQVDAELIATLPVRNNLAWVTAAVVGIPAAAGVWLFGELFKDELDSMASITYRVTGDIDAPTVEAQRAEDVVQNVGDDLVAPPGSTTPTPVN